MSGIGDLRAGRAARSVAVAVISTSCIVGGTAWTSWQLYEGGDDTLASSQFGPWLTLVAAVAVSVVVIGAVFWKGVNVRLGVAGGLVLSALAITAGLLVDVLASSS